MAFPLVMDSSRAQPALRKERPPRGTTGCLRFTLEIKIKVSQASLVPTDVGLGQSVRAADVESHRHSRRFSRSLPNRLSECLAGALGYLLREVQSHATVTGWCRSELARQGLPRELRCQSSSQIVRGRAGPGQQFSGLLLV